MRTSGARGAITGAGHALPEAGTTETGIGIVAHEVLKKFFDRWAGADAEGQARPGQEELLRLTRERFLASLHQAEQVNEESLDQLLAQMRLLFERHEGVGGGLAAHPGDRAHH